MADDVTAMAINYLFFGLLFDVYLNETEDYELLKVIQPFFVFRGLVVASPVWYPNISMETRRKLFNFIKNVLEAERFDYKGVAKG